MSITWKLQFHNLLLALFSGSSLRQFIALGEHADALVPHLPADPVSPHNLVASTIDEVTRRGLIPWLFEDLRREFPLRHDDITSIETSWLDASPASARDLAALANYRQVIAAVHGSIRFIGIPHARNGLVRALQDAFVPPKLSRDEVRTGWSPSRLLTQLLAPRAVPLRVVVLGDPGGGKTTLCRFLTVVLAGAVPLDDVNVPTDIAPLHLVVRDYGDVQNADSPGLLDHLASRARSSGVSFTRDHIDRLCTRGRAVLIVDGLDEAGNASRRETLRDRILAFCALYPHVPVCLTTHAIGYDEVRLPEDFLHLTIDPLSDDELQVFVHRWYTALEPDDAEKRERGAADLLASIAAEPSVRALAGNPLLATLIALIHRDTTRLPGERVKLYELCIRTLLEKWPTARGKPFEEIDLTAQRRLLERLAEHLAIHRPVERYQVVHLIARDDLVPFLANLLHQEEPDTGDCRARVRRWIQFLHDESGLLSEYGPDRYAFAHRALQEYLAAACYVRTWPDPMQIVVEHRTREEFREVWLMMVGLLSANANACEHLYRELAAVNDDPTWQFLLACLGEEASFSPSALTEILEQSARIENTQPNSIGAALARLWRFSKRHAGSVQHWFLTRLHEERVALVSLARLAAASAPDVAPIVRTLDARPDRAFAAAELAVAFWPADQVSYHPSAASPLIEIGRWAWSCLKLPDAYEKMSTRGWLASEVCGLAFTAVQAGVLGPIRAAATLQLALDTLEVSSRAAVPSPSLVVEPGGIRVVLACQPPVQLRSQQGLGPAPFEERHHERSGHRHTQPLTEFTPCLDDTAALDSSALSHKAIGSLQAFGYLAAADAPRIEDFFADEFDIDASYSEPDEFGDYREWLRGNATPFSEFCEGIHDSLDHLCITVSADPQPIAPPDTPRTSDPYDFSIALRAARDAPDPEQAVSAPVLALHVLHAAHITAAATTFANDRILQEHAAVQRQQHVWLLQNWHTLEDLIPDLAEPVDLGLYLALGWVQCTTTTTWPGTPRWRLLFQGPAPAHWWPRIHWQLCWLLHEPAQPDRRAELDAALAIGEADLDLGLLARALRGALHLGAVLV